MKELQLKNFDVVEMENSELRNTEGGNIVVVALVAIAFSVCMDIAMNPSAHASAAKAGWDDAGK